MPSFPDVFGYERPEHIKRTYDQVDFNDRAQIEEARKYYIREGWIRVMQARIVRDKLQECYRREGVNHYENCRELAEMYFKMLKTHRVTGYKAQERIIDY
ncbi:hypothetical protein YB2330_003847 [Saitoella coloradoensis]